MARSVQELIVPELGQIWDFDYSPYNEWMQQQVRNVLWECDELGIRPRLFIHDNDSCFSKAFDAVLRHTGVRPLNTPLQAPNAKAYAS